MQITAVPAPAFLSLDCIELFAGMGGAALGLREAGFRCRLAVERWDPAAQTLHRLGFPMLPLDVDANGQNLVVALRRELRLDVPHSPFDTDRVGLLWASPPCQGLSNAGDRLGPNDDRDRWPATLVAIDTVRPQAFVGENVLGFSRHDRDCDDQSGGNCAGCAFDEVVKQIAARFRFSGVWKVDAADVGVPQHRTRVFIWGADHPLESPELTHGPGRAQPWVTLRDAIGETLLCPDRAHYPTDGSAGRSGSEPARLDRPSPTVMTTESKGTRASQSSGWTFHGGPDRASDATFLAAGVRRITTDEALRLQAFPPGTYVHGSVESVYAQIGNAVPPPLAAAIGRAVRKGWTHTR